MERSGVWTPNRLLTGGHPRGWGVRLSNVPPSLLRVDPSPLRPRVDLEAPHAARAAQRLVAV